ncbi:CybS-domain-containing protein [Dichotomocladium elegans]|nr:CybS-domain-containing protein [Dichotomocladium elegans]
MTIRTLLARSRPQLVQYQPSLFLRSTTSAAAATAPRATAVTDGTTSSTTAASTTTPETLSIEKEKQKKVEAEQGYQYGAYHWTAERASAVALIPLISTQLFYGAHPISDGLLGVVLPYHVYLGLDSCITDYIPKRVYPRGHRAANWLNTASMILVMWGCFEYNTNEIGLTEFIQRVWTA